MKKFILYIFYLQFYLYESLLISNKNTCSDCKYFIPNNMECKKNGKIDLITGKIINEPASIVRYDENKCGKKGRYFEKNYFKIITIPYYFLLENNRFILSIIYSFMPLIILFILKNK